MSDEIVKFVRGDDVKYTFERFEQELKNVGFVRADKKVEETPDSTDEANDERSALFEEARALGLEPHHRTGVEKLKEMIAEAKQAQSGE